MIHTEKMNLRQRLADYRNEHPKARLRQIATALHCSELELQALEVGDTATWLALDFKGLLKEIPRLGRVMALTRNGAAVHEKKGQYDKISFFGGAANMGLVLDEAIDLRLFMNHWAYGLAVRLDKGKRELLGFQFFDARGMAVHKIYLQPQSDKAVYEELVERFAAEVQPQGLILPLLPEVKKQEENEAVDAAAFQEAWLSLKDTHDFHSMLRSFELPRTQALRLAPEGHTRQVDPKFTEALLEKAVAQEVPIMVFVGNKGCIQIHSGPIKRLKWMGSWLNILDPDFNLHLQMEEVAEAWIVRKPTSDGLVNSLELYNAVGEQVVSFFGARKPGIPELEAWTALLT